MNRFILTYAIAAFMYWLSYLLWPKMTPTKFDDVKDHFEHLANCLDEEEVSSIHHDVERPFPDKLLMKPCSSISEVPI